MGKIRIKTLGVKELEKKQKDEARKRREAKKQAQKDEKDVKDNVEEQFADTDQGTDKNADQGSDQDQDSDSDSSKRLPPQARRKRVVGKNYKVAKRQIKDKTYSLDEALKLLKKMSYAQFDETVELHLNVREKNLKGEVNLPHGIGKKLNIAIADDALLKKIEAGDIDFDLLIASPSFMPKLVPFAKVLGPKGLMPNPKTGTLADDPKKAAEKLQGGEVPFRTEPKFPLMHQAVGKLSFGEKKLTENIAAFISAVQKKNVKEAFLNSSMTPSIQLDVESI